MQTSGSAANWVAIQLMKRGVRQPEFCRMCLPVLAAPSLSDPGTDMSAGQFFRQETQARRDDAVDLGRSGGILFGDLFRNSGSAGSASAFRQGVVNLVMRTPREARKSSGMQTPTEARSLARASDVGSAFAFDVGSTLLPT